MHYEYFQQQQQKKYDFMIIYLEDNDQPTLFTVTDHLTLYPVADVCMEVFGETRKRRNVRLFPPPYQICGHPD